MRINSINKTRLVGFFRTEKTTHNIESVENDRRVNAVSSKNPDQHSDQNIEYVFSKKRVSGSFDLDDIEEAQVIEEETYQNTPHEIFHSIKSNVDILSGFESPMNYNTENISGLNKPANRKHQKYFNQMMSFAKPVGDWVDARA